MAPRPFSSPLRRDVALVLLALALLTAPLWAATLQVGDPTVEYDRHEVVANESAIEYADEDDVPPSTPISDRVDCAGWYGDLRACAFEDALDDGATVPAGLYTSNPNTTSTPPMYSATYYDYVQLEGQLYEPTLEANASAERDDGMYRVDLALEPTDPDDVLRFVSVDAGDDEIPAVVAEAARDGPTTDRADVEVPEAPIEVGDEGDETYYRVVQIDSEDPGAIEAGLSWVLTYVAPLAGLFALASVARRVDVTYVGDER